MRSPIPHQFEDISNGVENNMTDANKLYSLKLNKKDCNKGIKIIYNLDYGEKTATGVSEGHLTNYTFTNVLDNTKIKDSQQIQIIESNENPTKSKWEKLQIDEKCAICHKILNFARDLEIHARKFHPNSKALKCKICSARFSNISSVSAHISTFHKSIKEQHDYEISSKNLITSTNLDHHLNNNNNKIRLHSCYLCKKSFRSYNSLRSHQIDHMNEIIKKSNEESLKKRYECKFCTKSLPNMQSWKRHLKVHSLELSVPCYFCAETFENEEKLYMHAKNAHPGKSLYKCFLCKKNFLRGYILYRHLKMSKCNKKLLRKQERPYRCSFCQKTYINEGHLKNHQRLHCSSEIDTESLSDGDVCNSPDVLHQNAHAVSQEQNKKLKEYYNYETDPLDIIEISKTEFIPNEDIANTARRLKYNCSPKECHEMRENTGKDKNKVSKTKHTCQSCSKVFNFERDLAKHTQLFHRKRIKCIGYRARFLNIKSTSIPKKRSLKELSE